MRWLNSYTLGVSPALYATVWIALGFLLGSIPFGYLVARARGMDIRKVGSGNIGMTNVWRALGWKAGVTVLLLDALKGWLPVFCVLLPQDSRIAIFTPGGTLPPAGTPEQLLFLTFQMPMLVGLAAILGHTFSPWMKFKGGKGVATGLGVVLALFGWWCMPLVLIFLVTLAISRYVSLGSVIAACALIALPFVAGLLPQPANWAMPAIAHLWPFALLAGGLVIYTHRENLKRIASGTERKVGAKNREALPG